MVRLTGGAHRGRSLKVPSGERTRPTQARVRQAWLNSIQFEVVGARVLDLFSGSGALGFEALSRGASSVVFVEEGRAQIQCLRQNAELLAVDTQIDIFQVDVWTWLKGASRREDFKPFDLIFADPPYAKGFEVRLLTAANWSLLLAKAGKFCLEWSPLKGQQGSLPEEVEGLCRVREKEYGDTVLSTYAWKDQINKAD